MTERSNTPLGDEALAAKPIQPGEAVDLCNRVAAALNLAPGNAFQDRDAWEKLARTLAQRFDTFEEVSVWRLRAEEVGELGTRAPQSETAAPVVQSAVAPTTDYYCGPCNWNGQLPRPPSGHPKCPDCGAYLSEPQSAKLRSDDWHDELLLRWCEWTGGHLSDQNFLRIIHDIVNDNLLPGSMRAPDRTTP